MKSIPIREDELTKTQTERCNSDGMYSKGEGIKVIISNEKISVAWMEDNEW